MPNKKLKILIQINLSYMFFNLLINATLDTIINVYTNRLILINSQTIFYSVIFCFSIANILLILLNLNIIEKPTKFKLALIMLTNAFYLSILLIQSAGYYFGILYKYSNEDWINVVYFIVNLVLIFISFLVYDKYYFKFLF